MKAFCKELLVLFVLGLAIKINAQNGVYFIPTDKQIDSISSVLHNTNDDTLKMCAYYYISSYYTELNQDSALYYGKRQLDISNKLNQQLWAADALSQIAYIDLGFDDISEALNSITEGLAITNDASSEKNNWHMSTFSGDGNVHRARMFIAAALHQIFGLLYNELGSYTKAKDEFTEAIKIAESVDDKTELSQDYMCLGVEHYDKFDSALMIEQKALLYALQADYKIYLGRILLNIGHIYYDQGEYDSAGKYYHDAIPVSISQNNLEDEIDAFFATSTLQRKINEIDSSLYYAEKGLATSRTFGNPLQMKEAYNELYLSFKLMHKTDSAFRYIELERKLGDSLGGAYSIKVNQYRSLILNLQTSEQQKEKAKIQSANKTRTYILLAGIFVLLLIAFLLFNNNRNRKKANELLMLQKKEIERQKETVENTLSELKSTQAQLIQSEKMASLGELTAGIAHEIQNPLNFVNNFSEVNKEMLEELKAERLKPNADKASEDEIINDIISNEEKINHHGKRADAIVRGMLQHSRQTKGVKEPTDINALCGEYLKLSYHGMRAKDKNFNADFKTDFDESIGNINIVPQDIGRVLLNVYNNAFYAVSEKRKQLAENFEPTVSVNTKKVGDKVEIRVSDNGNGIPQNIIDKIFQPFFTTKPTGQGTGLGLSLAYDIITKEHNGTIKVESKEGEGTIFIIQLEYA